MRSVVEAVNACWIQPVSRLGISVIRPAEGEEDICRAEEDMLSGRSVRVRERGMSAPPWYELGDADALGGSTIIGGSAKLSVGVTGSSLPGSDALLGGFSSRSRTPRSRLVLRTSLCCFWGVLADSEEDAPEEPSFRDLERSLDW